MEDINSSKDEKLKKKEILEEKKKTKQEIRERAIGGVNFQKKRKLENDLEEVDMAGSSMSQPVLINDDKLSDDSLKKHEELLNALHGITDAIKAMHHDIIQLNNKNQ